ncbi:DUF6953 family protein [Paenibacillus tyrfis]|uniref:DUF6953 family protein n=1 Tax=Paenibacillus tyrfis TaxID=1501230 RepID=UPI00209D3EF2|nr:hypothetical protein [Paenibacillus tyrfis]MCP1307676.1 hypothetical protein [Paenibacillus tyrfis]
MHKEIAQWLYDKIISEGGVYQLEAVHEISEKFGEKYTYYNDNGNLAIDKKITREFRKINQGEIVWDREEYRWLYIGDEEETKKAIDRL